MSHEPELQWVRPPLQERSQQTLDRLLSAAEALILEVGFEKATVAEIVRRAESSVGSFYTRFKDKEALLRCLVERFVQEAQATADSALRPELWVGCNNRELCKTLLRFTDQMFTERTNLLRAISSVHPGSETNLFRVTIMVHLAERLEALLRARNTEMKHADPVRACHVLSWMCMHSFEGSDVQGPVNPQGLSRDETLDELTEMILGYLQVDGDACPDPATP